MIWQPDARHFTVKSTDFFYSVQDAVPYRVVCIVLDMHSHMFSNYMNIHVDLSCICKETLKVTLRYVIVMRQGIRCGSQLFSKALNGKHKTWSALL